MARIVASKFGNHIFVDTHAFSNLLRLKDMNRLFFLHFARRSIYVIDFLTGTSKKDLADIDIWLLTKNILNLPTQQFKEYIDFIKRREWNIPQFLKKWIGDILANEICKQWDIPKIQYN
ncbi:MAG: hypothetical protein LBP72_08480 [Dysgonamonadaceae bacterium]|nr:hypothetical protein [Dysgonamonadaceae bacterium]